MTAPDPQSKEDELAGTEAPFVSHLVELRDRLIRALIAVVIAFAALAFPHKNPIRPRFIVDGALCKLVCIISRVRS